MALSRVLVSTAEQENWSELLSDYSVASRRSHDLIHYCVMQRMDTDDEKDEGELQPATIKCQGVGCVAKLRKHAGPMTCDVISLSEHAPPLAELVTMMCSNDLHQKRCSFAAASRAVKLQSPVRQLSPLGARLLIGSGNLTNTAPLVAR